MSVPRNVMPRVAELDADPLPEVPPYEIDRFGNRVDTSGPIWRFNEPSGSFLADWARFPDRALRRAFQLWICHSIKAHSPIETSNQFRAIAWEFELMGRRARALSDLDLSWWRDLRHELEKRKSPYRLSRIRAAFLWMADKGFSGVSEEVAFEIEQWVIPGNVKGEAVTRRDPDAGPLSDEQLQVLLQSVHRSAPTVAKAIALLGIELGLNPKNMLLLEERDLRRLTDPKTGRVFYQLDVPRIKKRNATRETRRRQISEKAGFVLETLIDHNRNRFGGEEPQRPILCRDKPRTNEVHYLWHFTSTEIALSLRKFGESCDLRLPGGENSQFSISPRRLRYTFATRLAVQGQPPAVIADLLDHTDLQHVGVYIDFAGRMVNELSSALGPALKPVYDQFLGRMVDRPEDAVPDDPGAHVWARVSGKMMGGIGTCGQGVPCGLAPPFACYRCPHFQAWRPADHAGLLENVQELRSAFEQRSGDPAGLASIDVVIGAIREAISLQSQPGVRRLADDGKGSAP